MFTTARCSAVGLVLDFVSGWLVVMHTSVLPSDVIVTLPIGTDVSYYTTLNCYNTVYLKHGGNSCHCQPIL